MVYRFSAPGRTEIGGNHTDHQHGCVLAAAVELEAVADVTLNGTDFIRVCSQGYPETVVDLKDLSVREEESPKILVSAIEELPDNEAFDRRSDVADAVARACELESAVEALLGYLDESFCLIGNVSASKSVCAVSVKALIEGADVDFNDVALF